VAAVAVADVSVGRHEAAARPAGERAAEGVAR
jgi:hypothetical protein